MNWLHNLLRGERSVVEPGRQAPDRAGELAELRRRFDCFHELVERNNEVLSVISDMEEKAQGEYLFDLAYIRRCVDRLQAGVLAIIERIVELGGADYDTLRARYEAILSQVCTLLPGRVFQLQGPFVLGFDRINRLHAPMVGGKNAQLGEMRSLGLNVPEGFAITATAYQHFLEANQLHNAVTRTLGFLDIRSQRDLERAGETLRGLILAAPLPPDLEQAIYEACDSLLRDSGDCCVALRSSAVGEDSLFSFAGQYSSYLNVPRAELLDRYRQILASKYRPRAIYYFLSHSLEEAGLSMSVACTRMVDAATSGVVYSRDPLDPAGEAVYIHAVYGLGPYLVDGVLTPDVFTVDRNAFQVMDRRLHDKPVQLRLAAGGGTRELPVSDELRLSPCLNDDQLRRLADLAVRLERHYEHPQDIEFAFDPAGSLFVLQSRPLHTICTRPSFELPDLSGYTVLASGGTTVCPGAGSGKVVHVTGPMELVEVDAGDVIVAANPFPALVRALDRAAAVVTEVGSSASHMAALVREKRIPTLAGLAQARKHLPPGETVTVDASGCCVYFGDHPELVQARRPEYDLFQDTAIFELLRSLLRLISPLNLVHPGDPEFRAERCLTFHDITRFAHQRGIEEVFSSARSIGQRREYGARLKTTLPLPVHILNLDDPELPGRREEYDEHELPSDPMQVFWDGMQQEKWPFAHPDPARLTVNRERESGLPVESQFTEHSFAVLRREYMLASLRLGYHFTSVEAVLCDDSERNFIRVHYKGGGAADARRRRRIGLLEELLDRMGFEHSVRADFIDCRALYLPRDRAELNLNRVGRLVMLTKQLDMALSNERITRWYIEEFARKLGLDFTRVFPI